MERATSYSVWSRGRLIGHTDLGYVRSTEKLRMGDLITTEIGDRVLETDAAGHPAVPDLELRGPDGVAIPAKDIAIRDTEYLLAIARRLEDEPEPILPDEEAAALEAAIEDDAALVAEWMDAAEGPELSDGQGRDVPWQEAAWPRYQILVFLFDDAAIP